MVEAKPIIIVHVDDEEDMYRELAPALLRQLRRNYPTQPFQIYGLSDHSALNDLLQGKEVAVLSGEEALMLQGLTTSDIGFIITDNDTHASVKGSKGAGMKWIENRRGDLAKIPCLMYSAIDTHAAIPLAQQGITLLPKDMSDKVALQEMVVAIGNAHGLAVRNSPQSIEHHGVLAPDKGRQL